MRFLHTFIALSLIAAISTCTAAQDTSTDDKPVQEHAPTTAPEVADPMASFARMIGGEWKVTFASGTSMYDTYHWGPGKHSGRVMTHGEDAAGNPWRGLSVVYWHPGRKQLRSLGLSPYEGSVSEGPVNSVVVGDTTESASDLYQNGVHRKLVSRDTFDGPDKYHSALLEEIEPGKLTPLTEWDYFRSKTLTPQQPLSAENPPKPSERLKALVPLVGRIWDATIQTKDWREFGGDAVHIESTFEWIPYIDAIYARSFALRGNGEPTHVLDAYFYHHTGTDTLRCLALSNWGGQSGVYEGDITLTEGGALQFDLKGYEGDQAVARIVHFDFEKDGTLHHRVWSLAGDGAAHERMLMLDVHHTASEMSKGIWYVFQDTKNNYWFGSDGQGVYRFDGTTITHFTTKDGLCNDRIRGIQQHLPTGDILITTLDGVSKYDGQQFVTLPATELDSPDKGWVLQPDDVWLPWQPGQNGPYRYDGKTLYHLKFPKHPREDEFYATHPTRPWSPYEVYCVYKDRKGHMWFGTANFGICRFDGKHLDWMYEDHLTQIEGGGMFGIRSIFEDKGGAFWFCNTQYRYFIEPHDKTEHGNGLIKYKREPGMDLSRTSLRDVFFYFMSMTDDDNGDLWMATWGGGVWRYDGKNITHYSVKDGDTDVTLFSISNDNRGDLWLGTHEAGPHKFNGKTFEKWLVPKKYQPARVADVTTSGRIAEPVKSDPYFTPTDAKSTPFMPRVIIRNICEDRAGNIWFATFGGPIRYDGKDFTSFGEEVGLAKTRIFSLLEDRSGALWFGSITGGASRYDGTSFTTFTEKDGLGNNDVTWIFEDRDANIWFATGNGVSRYDGKSMTNFTTKDGLVHNAVYTIGQDSAGRLWFGTQGGICTYDGTSFSNLADQVGRSFVNIRAIVVDRSGNLWIGGQEGAFRYDGKTLATFTSKEGLLDDFVGSMIVDRAGNIWFGHPGQFTGGNGGGATRYDGKSFRHFTHKDGLGSRTVYSMLEDKAGNIWFGSADAGACRYDGKTFTNFSATAPNSLPAQGGSK